jgi:hypothetical protein
VAEGRKAKEFIPSPRESTMRRPRADPLNPTAPCKDDRGIRS